MAVWVVRGGLDGEYEEDAPEKCVIRIGFDMNVDLTDASEFDDVKNLVQWAHEGAPQARVANFAGQIWAFKGEMQIGDLIIVPRKGPSIMAVGEVTGRYEYSPPASHTRSVRWINEEVPRGPFVGPLETPMTVFRPYLGENVDVEMRLRAIVGEKNPQWDAFIHWARLFYEREDFNEYERDYKLLVGERLAAVKQALRDGNVDWEDMLRKTFAAPDSYLRDWRTNNLLLSLDPPRLEEALRRIWGLDGPTFIRPSGLEERVRVFQELGPFGTPALMASILLMGDGPTQYPMYRYTSLKDAYRLTGYSSDPNNSPDAWERYEHSLGFYDEFIGQASMRGLKIRDRLDAQGLVWCVTHYGKENMPDDWPEELKDQLIAYRAGELTEVPPPIPPDPWSSTNIESLAAELLWEPDQLQEIIDDLQEKRQVIFHGPPGTGKTYVAKRIAKHAQDCGGGFEIVQFHPSYSYEDFVQGFRPKLHNGQPGFDLVDGPLLRIAEQARANPDATFILVIDELNRGNVAKVFGELYFLLEYRDEAVRLQYGGKGQGFSLPPNLWFICTMNTADRSIALMDAALRRRFYFAPFFPDEPPVEGLLRRWLGENDPDNAWVAALVDRANEKLDRDTRIGPSYFMVHKDYLPLDESRVRRIWNRAVIPYVEEQCFGDDAKLREFDFDRLRRQLDGMA